MTSEIAVICVYNPKNAGMYSVDMAGREFFAAHQMSPNFFVTQGRNRIGRLSFKKVRNADDLKKYRRIVYWGDFQNNPMWGQRDFSNREVSNGDFGTIEEAFKFWRELYLELGKKLSDSTKIYSVGSCFLGMLQYLKNPEVKDSLEYFLTRSDGVVVRDQGSYQLLKSSFSSDITDSVRLGYDVASLLNAKIRENKSKEPYFVFSFGRSDLSEPDIDRLVRELELKLGIKAVPINWLKPALLFGSRKFFNHGFFSLLKLIAGAAFTLTDIYHLSINSLNLKTPVICLYNKDSNIDDCGTLNDDKKRILFEMLDSTDFLFPVNDKKISAADIEEISQCAWRIYSISGSAEKALLAHKNKSFEFSNQISNIMGLK